MARTRTETAFLNMPHSPLYEERLLALLSSLALYGLIPTAAIVEETITGLDRLNRIISSLVQSTVSIHDLSWTDHDIGISPAPRFNMPFELGLAVGLQLAHRGNIVIIDTVPHRLDRTLSDISGIDVEIVDDTPLSVFRAISNTFHRRDFQPQPRHFQRVLRRLHGLAETLRHHYGYAALFEPKPFADLRRAAAQTAHEIRQRSRPRKTTTRPLVRE